MLNKIGGFKQLGTKKLKYLLEAVLGNYSN